MPKLPVTVASEASRKAWRSRKRMKKVRGDRGGAPRPESRLGKRVGSAAVIEATMANPEASSAVIAKALSVTPDYVRKCWERARLPRRSKKRPLLCAVKPRRSMRSKKHHESEAVVLCASQDEARDDGPT